MGKSGTAEVVSADRSTVYLMKTPFKGIDDVNERHGPQGSGGKRTAKTKRVISGENVHQKEP